MAPVKPGCSSSGLKGNKMNLNAQSFGRVIYKPKNQADNIYKASIGCNGFIGNRYRFWAIKDCLETTYLPGLKQKILGIGFAAL